MPRPIDADALSDAVAKAFDGRMVFEYGSEVVSELRSIIDSQPSVEAPGVKHGCWIGYTVNRFYGVEGCEPIPRNGTIYRCSVCRMFSVRRNYCPNCGSRMDLTAP